MPFALGLTVKCTVSTWCWVNIPTISLQNSWAAGRGVHGCRWLGGADDPGRWRGLGRSGRRRCCWSDPDFMLAGLSLFSSPGSPDTRPAADNSQLIYCTFDDRQLCFGPAPTGVLTVSVRVRSTGHWRWRITSVDAVQRFQLVHRSPGSAEVSAARQCAGVRYRRASSGCSATLYLRGTTPATRPWNQPIDEASESGPGATRHRSDIAEKCQP